EMTCAPSHLPSGDNSARSTCWSGGPPSGTKRRTSLPVDTSHNRAMPPTFDPSKRPSLENDKSTTRRQSWSSAGKESFSRPDKASQNVTLTVARPAPSSTLYTVASERASGKNRARRNDEFSFFN